jgi:hypothetical protein
MPDYPRHLSGFDYVGFHRYFLTFCTFERNGYFRDASSVGLVAEQFLRASGEQSMAITTYCFMPDHVHLLVQGIREDADLKSFVSRAKQYSGGLDPVSWTLSEGRIRCPHRWQTLPRGDDRVAGSTTTSKRRPSGWSSTKARASALSRATSI